MASNVTLTRDTELNLVIKEQIPSILAQVHKDPDSTDLLEFSLISQNHCAIRRLIWMYLRMERIDSEGDKIIQLKSGNGTLTIPTIWLSSDRLRANVSYTPATGQTSFSLTVTATFTAINTEDGSNYSVQDDFVSCVGIGKQKSARITNAGGGEVGLDDDPSKFVAQAGTFGSDASLGVDVVLRSADQADDLANVGASSAKVARVMAKAKKLGYSAYPAEMSHAIVRAQETGTTPFGSFYDIFLPAGVSHFFPQGKQAQLCLKYDEYRISYKSPNRSL